MAISGIGFSHPLTFDRYLWPSYSDDVSNYHVLLIVLMVNVKSREKVPIWGKELIYMLILLF